MKLRTHKRLGFTLVELLVVVSIILALAGMSYPVIMRQIKAADRVKLANNAKNVFMAMGEFDSTFNGYPDDDTADRIENDDTLRKVEGLFLTGDTSNPYYRQLFAAGKIETEETFYVDLETNMGRTRKPDLDVANGQGLAKGECAMGYVMRDFGDHSMGMSAKQSGVPVPVIISIPNETTNAALATYDVRCLDSKVFVHRSDNSGDFIDLNDDTGMSDKIFRRTVKGKETVGDYKVYRPDL